VNPLPGADSAASPQLQSTSHLEFQILPVQTAAEQELFLRVPAIVYASDPNWVPPLQKKIASQFAPSSPFFQYGKLQQFIAISGKTEGRGDRRTEGRGEQEMEGWGDTESTPIPNSQSPIPNPQFPIPNSQSPIGRIVAAVNHRLVEREGQNIGLFGYFECIPDFTVAQALLDAACQWLREQGMTRVRGPIDLSTHNNCLFLVDGFDTPPVIMMPYNPPTYPQFMEQDGWQRAKDAYAYYLPLDKPLPPEYEKGYRIACKSGVSFRLFRTKGEGFTQDCIDFYRLFTQAFANNWSSSSRTEAEFLEAAKSLQSSADPALFPIAEYNGEMIGFCMALPDYNVVLKQVNGKLDLIGILKALWYRRQIDRVRTIAICSLPEHRRKMVALALIHLCFQGATQRRKPYKWAELSWVYEDNLPSRNLIEGTGAHIYKTFRIYEKGL
jgi:GNAT superfamily N-acetyltransferase